MVDTLAAYLKTTVCLQRTRLSNHPQTPLMHNQKHTLTNESSAASQRASSRCSCALSRRSGDPTASSARAAVANGRLTRRRVAGCSSGSAAGPGGGCCSEERRGALQGDAKQHTSSQGDGGDL